MAMVLERPTEDGSMTTDRAPVRKVGGEMPTGCGDHDHRRSGRRRMMVALAAASAVLIAVVVVRGTVDEDPVSGAEAGVDEPVTVAPSGPSVSSGDGSLTVTATPEDGATSVLMADGDDRTTDVVELAGAWEPVTVDHVGRKVALVPDLGPGRTIYDPGGRRTSLITVIDRTAAEPRVEILTMAGNVVPEAFSLPFETNEPVRTLFVIDHRPAMTPDSYRVAGLDLSTGERYDLNGPDKEPLDEDMRGVGRQQALAPNGRQLYTYYSRQLHDHDAAPDGGHHDDAHHRDAYHEEAEQLDGFVHVLDLQQHWAYCLDMPASFGDGPAASSAIGVSPDGETLVVVDTWAGQAALIDTDPLLRAASTATVDPLTRYVKLPAALDRAEDVTVEIGDAVVVDGPGGPHRIADL